MSTFPGLQFLLALLFVLQCHTSLAIPPEEIDREVKAFKSRLEQILPPPRNLSEKKGRERSIQERVQAFQSSLLTTTPSVKDTGYFGPEFTLHNSEFSRIGLNQNDEVDEMVPFRRWRILMEKQCKENRPQCKATLTGKPGLLHEKPLTLRVEYENGHWYQMHLDQGVLEFNMNPMTPSQVREFQGVIQRDIFDVGQKLGFNPHPAAGGGHIHIDIETVLKNSPLILRNMLVDLENHPAMFLGGISHAYGESPLAIESPGSRVRFLSHLKQFDQEVLTSNDSDRLKVIQLAKLMSDAKRSPALAEKGGLAKSHLVNLQHLDFLKTKATGPFTLEIRGLDPQKGAETYALQTELFLGRAKYLATLNKPIPYTGAVSESDLNKIRDDKKPDHINLNKLRKNKSNRSIILNEQQSVDEFYSYVTEAGMSWKKFQALLDPDLKGRLPTPLAVKLEAFLKVLLKSLCVSTSSKENMSCQEFLDKAAGHFGKVRHSLGICLPELSQIGVQPLAEQNREVLQNVERVTLPLTEDHAPGQSKLTMEEVRAELKQFAELHGIPQEIASRYLPSKKTRPN